MAQGRCAILMVNGYDRHGRWGDYDLAEARQFPWIDLCLRQIERHSSGADYEVLVYDNSWLREQRELLRRHPRVRVLPRGGARVERGHPSALDILVRETLDDVEYIITMDTDAFPVRDGWIEQLTDLIAEGAGVSGIYRDEFAPKIRPFIHLSCLCARRKDLLACGVSFMKGKGQDVGQNLSDILSRDHPIAPLRRSNARNFHVLLGGLYGDLVYHHGAGSRRARFWGCADREWNERVRTTLRDAAFLDLSKLIAVLRGECEDGFGLATMPRATIDLPMAVSDL